MRRFIATFSSGLLSTSFQFIKQEFDEKTTMNLIELENKIEIKKDEFKLDEKKLGYQLETKSKIMDYYKLNNRCIMSMPCGVGKTYISYLKI